MLNRFSLFISILALGSALWSCQTKPEKVLPPKDVIDKELMTEVLADVHLAEAKGLLSRMPRTTQDSIALSGYLKVLRQYDISEDYFLKSFEWYNQHPAVFEPMYQDVINTIKSREKQLTEESRKRDKAMKDSIKRLKENDTLKVTNLKDDTQ